jgi:HAD superfamily hydrolase (TIGR01490 family)
MKDSMAKPFAVFDIDGTLIRWQLYHAIADRLVKNGSISLEQFDEVKESRLYWKKRLSDDAFHDYESTLIKVVDAALQNIKVADFEAAADEVFNEYKYQVYTFTRDLIVELKSKNYLIFAISGSPDIIIKKLANFYGFDDYKATTFGAKNGKFDGTKDLTINKKSQLLEELIVTHNATKDQSYGLGDTESDIEMLSQTDNPICFNPSRKLYEYAKTKGWRIVVERKNVTYSLNEVDHKYKLDL